MFTNHMYKENLAFNNLQGLACHKTQSNQKQAKLHSSSHEELFLGLPIVCLLQLQKGIPFICL